MATIVIKSDGRDLKATHICYTARTQEEEKSLQQTRGGSEIIGGLLSDKNELVRIAQTFEQEFIAQRISQTDVEYLSNNLLPIISGSCALSVGQFERLFAVMRGPAAAGTTPRGTASQVR
jgi:hypothetical protein